MAESRSNSISSEDENLIPSPTPSPPRNEERPKLKRCKTVAVEGNIGCGKTTFLKTFSRYKNIEILAEPVDKWKNVMGVNALDLMYKDAERWSCAFQSLVTLSMLDHHSALKNPNHVKMIERSIYSTRYCFMQNLKDNGLIPPMEFEMLNECHNWVYENEHIELDLIVYLRASPEVCSGRIKKRNRAEESGVPLDYLRSLHQLHDDWLIHGKRGKLPCPVWVIDANKDQCDLESEIEALRQDIICEVTSDDVSDVAADLCEVTSELCPALAASKLQYDEDEDDEDDENIPALKVQNKTSDKKKKSNQHRPVLKERN